MGGDWALTAWLNRKNDKSRAAIRQVFSKSTDRARVLTGMVELWFDPDLNVIDWSLVCRIGSITTDKSGEQLGR